ncbi:F-box/kelch-repeat protein At3g23880-like [Apium graveolens]|uniref:F-box/kelch-repeat protein At3g23880-like n=1 Tax=Apium graveolens TaxID=4045 RepID=UPI003D7B0D64
MDKSIDKGKRVVVLLPEEMTREEILTRLPVKSLVRFQSVCKLWESYLYDPDFLKAHVSRNMSQNPKSKMTQNPNYPADDHLVALHSNALRILSPSNQTYKDTNTRVLPMSVYYLLGSVNGLVCVSKFNKFLICNIALGKVTGTYLASSLYDKHVYDDDNYARILGFGWDHVRNDYKIVACYISPREKRGAVYSSSSGSWTRMVIPNAVFRSNIYQDGVTVLTPTTIVNNCPYWRYTYNVAQTGRNSNALVKFEFESNEFKEMPVFDHESVDGKDFDFVNIKDCLAVMVYNKTETVVSSVDVHSLDEVSGIWIKMYTMEPIDVEPINAVDVPSVQVVKGYVCGGEIVFNDQGKLFCYDLETKVITSFLGCSGFFTADCFNYTPTLVFLPEMKKKVQFI